MRHRVAHRKLGRDTEHRMALLRNQAGNLLRHERIQTTVPKAKELRPFVERLITIAKRGLVDGEEIGRALHARRLVRRDLPDRELVSKLFDVLAPRFASRPGGYTRLLRVGHRQGDNAELAQLELVGSEYNVSTETESSKGEEVTPTQNKGVGSRLRAAVRRARGTKDIEPSPTGKQERSNQTSAKNAGKRRRATSSHKKSG